MVLKTGSWWKVVTVIILAYVIIAGFLVPLKPGFENVSPSRAVAGEIALLRAEGYNISYPASQKGKIRAWLKLNDSLALTANQVVPWGANTLQISFSLPEEFPVPGNVHALSLVVDDETHGSIVVPSALFVTDCVFDPNSEGLWKEDPVRDLHRLSGFRFPYRSILHETIRNTYFHVPMWFGMIIMFFISAWFSIRFVQRGAIRDDFRARAFVLTGAVYGLLGIGTGMFWSTYTWGAAWSWDIKQNTAAITLLIYFAYFILRQSFDDIERRARIAAVYNIFACIMVIPLLFVIPRMTDSLHPGSGGNPALGGEDLDNTMRMVFYPAVIGWTLLGIWISNLTFRVKTLRERVLELQNN